MLKNTNSVNLCQNSEAGKPPQNGKRPQKPYKISVFKEVIQTKMRMKKMDFSKNCLTQCVSGREKKRAFSCTLSVLAKQLFWDQNSQKPGKPIKIAVSVEIAQNQKWHLFFEKGVLWHGLKSGFY